MNPYFQTDMHHLHPNAAYGAPPYYAQQHQPAHTPSAAVPTPSIRLVDPQIAYAHSQPAATLPIFDQQSAIFPYDDYATTYTQNGYTKPDDLQRAFQPEAEHVPPQRENPDPSLSPIKQHIQQIREEAEEWRRKWMTSQVIVILDSLSCVLLISTPKSHVRA
jgi:hypothetical protein